MILELIRKAVPQDNIISYEKFAEGYNNTSYDVKTSSGEYVLKVLRKSPEEKLLLKQQKIVELLLKKFPDFPIQKVIQINYDHQPPYALLEKLPGQSLKSAYEDIENKDELFEEIGRRYGQLHMITFSHYGWLNANFELVDTYDDYAFYSMKKIEEKLQKSKKFFDEDTFQKYLNFYERNKYLFTKDVGPRLRHGDSSLTNIIVKKENGKWVLSGFIDFEFASSGPVVFDLFKSLRTYRTKIKHAAAYAKGHAKYLELPEAYREMALFYAWCAFIDSLSGITTLSWPNLDEAHTTKRRENILKETLLALEDITKLI